MADSKQMSKKEIVELLACFTLISTSKQGEELINKYFTIDQIEKIMKTVVNLFDEDEKKAEAFILNRVKTLLKKLECHKLPESQRKSFVK